MLLIALVGGSTEERLSIADVLVGCGKGRLAAFAQNTPIAWYGAARSNLLRTALEGLEGRRTLAGGLIVVHCLSPEEAQLIREQGGVIWHLHARPSQTIRVLNQDLFISENDYGGHVRSPIEALSELLLANGLGKRATTLG